MFEPWEDDFIRLTFPAHKSPEIAATLKRGWKQIDARARLLGLKRRLPITIGDTFGRLEVITQESGKGVRKWRCRCRCGNETVLSTAKLLSCGVQSCGCLRLEMVKRGYGSITGTMFSQIRLSARARDIAFSISKEYLHELLLKQDSRCALTGTPIFISQEYANRSDTTASLDRKNSSLGYTEENVQWVHKDVNYMKMDFDESYFVETCKKVASYRG